MTSNKRTMTGARKIVFNTKAVPSSSGNPFNTLKNLEELVEEGEIGGSMKRGKDMQDKVVAANISEVQIKDIDSEETLPQEFRFPKILRNMDTQSDPSTSIITCNMALHSQSSNEVEKEDLISHKKI